MRSEENKAYLANKRYRLRLCVADIKLDVVLPQQSN